MTPGDGPKKPARGLGRGLSALMGDVAAPPVPTVAPASAVVVPPPAGEGAARGLRQLPTASLRPGKFQPRRHFDEAAIAGLAESLKNQGMLQPILVRKQGASETYEIIAGERRWRAAQAAGLHEVPVILRTLTDAEALEIALVENLQREDLNAIEEAEAYRRLMDEFGHTQEALASISARAAAMWPIRCASWYCPTRSGRCSSRASSRPAMRVPCAVAQERPARRRWRVSVSPGISRCVRPRIW